MLRGGARQCFRLSLLGSAGPAVSAFQKKIRGQCTVLQDHICKQMNELNLERCRCIPKEVPGADWRCLEQLVAQDPSRELYKVRPISCMRCSEQQTMHLDLMSSRGARGRATLLGAAGLVGLQGSWCLTCISHIHHQLVT